MLQCLAKRCTDEYGQLTTAAIVLRKVKGTITILSIPAYRNRKEKRPLNLIQVFDNFRDPKWKAPALVPLDAL